MSQKNKFILLSLIALSFIVLAIGVIQKNIFILNIDNLVYFFVQTTHSPFRDSFMVTITHLGDFYQILLLFIILGIIFIFEKKKYYFYIFSLSLGSSVALAEIIKILTQRVRPISMLVLESDYSFPSLHATVATVILLINIIYVSPFIKNNLIRGLFITFSSILFPLIALSRIYVSVHWTSDVLAGILLGSACYVFSDLAVSFFHKKGHILS